MNLTEERIVRKLDLQAFVNGLAHDDCGMILARSRTGVASIGAGHRRWREVMPTQVPAGLYALAVLVTLLLMVVRPDLRLRRFRQRTRARRHHSGSVG